MTQKTSPAQLVVRRGQEFKVKVFLDRIYDGKDEIRVISTIGKDLQCCSFIAVDIEFNGWLRFTISIISILCMWSYTFGMSSIKNKPDG